MPFYLVKSSYYQIFSAGERHYYHGKHCIRTCDSDSFLTSSPLSIFIFIILCVFSKGLCVLQPALLSKPGLMQSVCMEDIVSRCREGKFDQGIQIHQKSGLTGIAA